MSNKGKIIRTIIFMVTMYYFVIFQTIAQSLPNESDKSEEILTDQIRTVEISGNTVFSGSEIQQLFVEYQNQILTFADLLEISQRITNLYQQNGYITSEAILPTQTILNGIAKIQIVEGKLEKIQIKGRKNLLEDLVLSYFPSPGSILNTNDLVTSSRKLQRHPSVKRVDGQLINGTEFRNNILIVTIEENPPFELSLEVNNYRSFRIGTTQGISRVGYSNIIGIGDRLFGEYNRTEGFEAYSIGFSLPITAIDGMIEFEYRQGDSEIILDVLRDADIEAEVETFLLRYQQGIIDSDKRSINLGARFKVSENKTSLLGEPFSFSEGVEKGRALTSILSFTGDWVERNPNSSLVSRVELALGIDAMDATVNDDAPDGIFTLLRIDTQWTKALNRDRDVLFLWRFFGQFTPDSLLVTEKLSIGGVDTVRGTAQNQVFGDNGAGWNLGFYIPLWKSQRHQRRITLNPFFDGAAVWDSDGDNSNFLMSFGIGLIFQFCLKGNLRLIYGVPIVNDNNQDDETLQGNGLSFGVSWDF